MNRIASDSSFDALFESMAPRVLLLARRFTGDSDMAQDVLQETFLAVYRALPDFRADSAIETWVYRIAINEARRQSRRAVSQRARERTRSVDHVSDRQPGERDDLMALESAIVKLPETQREALCLLSLRGLRGAIAAEILGIPEGTLYSRAFAARAALRRLLERPEMPPS